MTYSIVARDAQTGVLGVAVQSHYFSVGSVRLRKAGIYPLSDEPVAALKGA